MKGKLGSGKKKGRRWGRKREYWKLNCWNRVWCKWKMERKRKRKRKRKKKRNEEEVEKWRKRR